MATGPASESAFPSDSEDQEQGNHMTWYHGNSGTGYRRGAGTGKSEGK